MTTSGRRHGVRWAVGVTWRGWRGCLALALAATLHPTSAPAQVQVSARAGRIDVSADAAPLSQVLERIAAAVGAAVEYEGAPPGQLVTLSLAARTPAEAVLSVLEGQGINYALQLDASGTRFEKLLIAVAAGGAVARRPRPAPAPTPPPAPVPPDPAAMPPELRELFERANQLGEDEPEGVDAEQPPETTPAPGPTPLIPVLPSGPLLFPGQFVQPRPRPTPTPSPRDRGALGSVGSPRPGRHGPADSPEMAAGNGEFDPAWRAASDAVSAST